MDKFFAVLKNCAKFVHLSNLIELLILSPQGGEQMSDEYRSTTTMTTARATVEDWVSLFKLASVFVLFFSIHCLRVDSPLLFP